MSTREDPTNTAYTTMNALEEMTGYDIGRMLPTERAQFWVLCNNFTRDLRDEAREIIETTDDPGFIAWLKCH